MKSQWPLAAAAGRQAEYAGESRHGISHDIRDFRGRSTVILETVVDPQAER